MLCCDIFLIIGHDRMCSAFRFAQQLCQAILGALSIDSEWLRRTACKGVGSGFQARMRTWFFKQLLWDVQSRYRPDLCNHRVVPSDHSTFGINSKLQLNMRPESERGQPLRTRWNTNADKWTKATSVKVPISKTKNFETGAIEANLWWQSSPCGGTGRALSLKLIEASAGPGFMFLQWCSNGRVSDIHNILRVKYMNVIYV